MILINIKKFNFFNNNLFIFSKKNIHKTFFQILKKKIFNSNIKFNFFSILFYNNFFIFYKNFLKNLNDNDYIFLQIEKNFFKNGFETLNFLTKNNILRKKKILINNIIKNKKFKTYKFLNNSFFFIFLIFSNKKFLNYFSKNNLYHKLVTISDSSWNFNKFNLNLPIILNLNYSINFYYYFTFFFLK